MLSNYTGLMALVRLGAFLLFATLVGASQNSGPKSGKPIISEPKLPVIDFDACGSPNPKLYSGKPLPYKLEADDHLYSTWRDSRTFIRNMARGTDVTRVGAVNIIRKPDMGVITGEVDALLRRGDTVLGYGLHSDGSVSFWGKGVWFTEDYDNIASNGSCGFADKTQCRINVTTRGVKEWWMQLKTSVGVTGWILGIKQNGDKVSWGPNTGLACRD